FYLHSEESCLTLSPTRRWNLPLPNRLWVVLAAHQPATCVIAWVAFSAQALLFSAAAVAQVISTVRVAGTGRFTSMCDNLCARRRRFVAPRKRESLLFGPDRASRSRADAICTATRVGIISPIDPP